MFKFMSQNFGEVTAYYTKASLEPFIMRIKHSKLSVQKHLFPNRHPPAVMLYDVFYRAEDQTL